MDRTGLEEATSMGANPTLSEGEFRRLAALIQSALGIRMPESKKVLLQSRLVRRLRKLGIKSFGEYCDFALSGEGLEDEVVHLIDAVTTNKTDFFREAKHFDFLLQHALPEMASSTGAGVRRKLRVWSAGCATGEEPYTLGMVLSEFGASAEGFNYSILATDVSLSALRKGALGIYSHDRALPVPQEMRKKYLLRSKDRNADLVRVAPGIRERVEFRRLNLLEEDYGISEPMDIIFFRNVSIYFEKDTQEMFLNRICRCLDQRGYLFVGHAETLHLLRVPLVQVAPAVYRRKN